MKQLLNLENWPRKDHFHFFRQFEEPFFGVCITIDCTKGYEISKARQSSFFLYYLYQSLVAVNRIEPFRYRIEGDQVFLYEKVNASSTIGRPDGTFGFSYIDYYEDFDQFNLEAQKEINRVRNSTGLVPSVSGENIVHYSSIPWLNFTALSHARSFSFQDSVPKISFGKMTDAKGRKSMPVSVHVHHALMDGFHVGLFVDEFQKQMDQPSH